MTDVFISKTNALTDRIADVLVAEGINAYLGGGKAELDECEYFLLIVDEESDLFNVETVRDWQYFYNEVKWKRKLAGEIIILLNEHISENKLPFDLRKCKSFAMTAPSLAVEYMKSGGLDNEKLSKTNAAFATKKEIKYTPSADSVKQIQFSARAPSVKRFDGTVNTSKRKDSEACRENHIYKELYSTKVDVKKTARPKAAPSKKNSFVGFSVLLVVLFMVVVVAVVVALIAWANNYPQAALEPVINAFSVFAKFT